MVGLLKNRDGKLLLAGFELKTFIVDRVPDTGTTNSPAAALLGKGSDAVAYNLMKKYDPRRIESSAMESAIRERMRNYPTPILMEPAAALPDKSPGEVIS